MGIVAASVGYKLFQPDADHFLKIMVETEQAKLPDDDPHHEVMMQTWARLCKCMKGEFAPYMRLVMPSLLQSAAIKPEITTATYENFEDLQSEGWEFLPVGD